MLTRDLQAALDALKIQGSSKEELARLVSIETTPSLATLSRTNGTQSAKATIPSEIEPGRRFVAVYADIAAAVKALATSPKLEIAEDNGRIILTGETGSASILSVEYLPNFCPSWHAECKPVPESLRTAVDSVRYACSAHGTGRPALDGVRIFQYAGRTLCCATDGHRAAIADVCPEDKLQLEATIHATTAAAFGRMEHLELAGTEGKIMMRGEVNGVKLDVEASTIYDAFPDVMRIVPKTDVRASCRVDAVLPALLAASALGCDSVTLRAKTDCTLEIQARTKDSVRVYDAVTKCDGVAGEVMANLQYLLEACRAGDAIYWGHGLEPILLLGERPGKTIGVVMPMRP